MPGQTVGKALSLEYCNPGKNNKKKVDFEVSRDTHCRILNTLDMQLKFFSLFS